MKTKLSIALLLYVAVLSCESSVEMGDDGLGEMLVMNARISTADSSHIIWLANSTRHGVTSVPDGAVSCFVNGELVATASQASETYERETYDNKVYFSAAGYRVNARIAPGDHVCIQAEAGREHCQADVDVLPPPTILGVRAFPCETDSDLQFGRYGFEIRLEDQPGVLNYHYLRLLDKSHVFVEKATGRSSYRTGDILDRQERKIGINTTGEPLLNSGARILGSQGSDEASFFDNKENLFTDLLYRDGEYTLRIFTDEQFFHTPDSMEDDDIMIVYTSAVLQVFNIPQEEYLSLSGYQFNHSKEGGSFLTADFAFPNNVKGGIGFISVDTAAEYEIAFPTRRVTIDTWPGIIIEE